MRAFSFAGWKRAALVVALVAVAGIFTGCSTINIEELDRSEAKLSPNPDRIYVAPFDTSHGQWLVGRQGAELENFKREYQTHFSRIMEERLMKVAPTELRWTDLPKSGWLVAGEFVKVYQGSRALRYTVGMGVGSTRLQTIVYVYDLSKSRDKYVLCFRTGVPENAQGKGAGSGQEPPRVSALVSGLTWDAIRTARRVRDVLMEHR